MRENIGLGDELLDDLFSLGGLKVNLDAFLASVGMRLGVTAPRWLLHTTSWESARECAQMWKRAGPYKFIEGSS